LAGKRIVSALCTRTGRVSLPRTRPCMLGLAPQAPRRSATAQSWHGRCVRREGRNPSDRSMTSTSRTPDSRSRFPLLMSPLRVGAIELRNRVVMGSLHTRLENEPDGVRKLAAFYEARAQGGVALIITGAVSPSREGRVE